MAWPAVLDSPESSLYKPRAPLRPLGGRGAQVAQLVEHCTENAGVGGSIPPLGTSNPTDRTNVVRVDARVIAKEDREPPGNLDRYASDSLAWPDGHSLDQVADGFRPFIVAGGDPGL